ncbi:unnamed protein product [Bemisia tabaci]|uniref:ZP domain-containing protein n=2 Tax=Bemisia tabaci TaxID=7038 RepID=A0A9P0CES2_BEMTA|nr:unnamed protein product [Bemisia tabaci]
MDISCFKSNTYAKFTAHLRTTRKLLFAPLLEGSKKKCKIQSLGEREYLLDLRGPDFLLCGVRQCNFQSGSEVFCLQLRFQNVKGLLMADDSLLKIECQAHRPKAHQLGRFSIPVEEDRKGEFRSASILARGGDTEPKMESDIFLLRKQGSQFNRLMRPGETLMLGEELMIKTSVRSKNDDDWQFSRMSDVVAQRVSKVNAATQSIDDDSDDTVVIVDTDGCRNPNLNDVCPLDPEQDKDDPLVTTLILRVFMMDSMLDGEELQITLRTTACVEYHDCNPNCLNSGSSWQNKLVRSRRNIPEKTANKNSSIFIKIEVPPGRIQQTKVAISEDDLHNRKPILPVSLICILSLIFAIVYKTIK